MAGFNSLLLDLSREITKSELETMKWCCEDYKIGGKRLDEITDARELFRELKNRTLLGPDNTGLLVTLLEKAGRIDLKNKVLKIQDSSRVQPCSEPDGPVLIGVLQDKHLNEIAEDLGRDWKRLGRKLGVSANVLDNIDEENRRVKEKAFQTMSRWKKQSGDNATEKALADALIAIERRDISEHLASTCKKDGINIHTSEEKPQDSHVQEESETDSAGPLDNMQADLVPNLPKLPTQESADS